MPRQIATPQQALRNAAELMLLLDEGEAHSVMSQLAEHEASQLQAAISQIDPHRSLLGASVTAAVDIDLDLPAELARQAGAGAGAGAEARPSGFSPSRLLSEPGHYVQGMLRQAFLSASHAPPEASLQSPSPRGGPAAAQLPNDGLARLKRTDLATVAHYLAGEHPQISAVILAWLEPEIAARILQLVPPRLRNDLMLRIAHLGVVQGVALQDLQEALADILILHESRKIGPHGGVQKAVQLLTRLGAHLEGPMMEAIHSQDPAMAQRISDRLRTNRKSGLGTQAAT